jgi:hypothetical protein
MIIKLPIIFNNKIIYPLFKLINQQNNIYECSLYNYEIQIDVIKILTCNENGVTYHNISIPFKIFIINSYYFTINFFIINLSSNFTNKLDFFCILNEIMDNKFKYKNINYKNNKINNNIIEILNKEYEILQDNNIILNYSGFIIMMNNFYEKKLINKKILIFSNNIKKINYSIHYSNMYNIIDHLKNIKNKELEIKDIKENLYYFLLINSNKIIHIKINKISNCNNKYLIYINNFIEPLYFDKYKWYIYPPDIKITINKIFLLMLNKVSFTDELLELKVIVNNNLNELFINYIFPFKYNKKEIDKNFDLILYHSLLNLQNNSFINEKIPNKIKLTYNNIIKIFNLLINNNITNDKLNFKIYLNDILCLQIFKILFLSNSLTYELLKKTVSSNKINEFKNELENTIIINDIILKLTWKNINKKLDYLQIIFDNKDYINKNLLPDNFDQRIKFIIFNPFEMFKYLRKEIDFIKWITFLENKYLDLYIIPISFCTNDLKILGKIIFYLFNIKEQTINDIFYKKILQYGNQYPKIILNDSRINLKIKENFGHLKCNINLGILAKHLYQNKNNMINFDNIEPIDNEKEILKENLIKITKKYIKYKKKYYSVISNI